MKVDNNQEIHQLFFCDKEKMLFHVKYNPLTKKVSQT
jgi:hypothetical protein